MAAGHALVYLYIYYIICRSIIARVRDHDAFRSHEIPVGPSSSSVLFLVLIPSWNPGQNHNVATRRCCVATTRRFIFLFFFRPLLFAVAWKKKDPRRVWLRERAATARRRGGYTTVAAVHASLVSVFSTVAVPHSWARIQFQADETVFFSRPVLNSKAVVVALARAVSQRSSGLRETIVPRLSHASLCDETNDAQSNRPNAS